MKSLRPDPEPRSKAVQIAVECLRCGDEFEPSHRDYVAGDWRVCPACRAHNDRASQPAEEGDTA